LQQLAHTNDTFLPWNLISVVGVDLIEANSDNTFRHPWELSRAHCILNILKNQKNLSFADIGAGDLFFSNVLKKSLNTSVSAVDVNFDENIKTRGLKVDGISLFNDLEKLSNNSVDCVILMDVLEHVEDDLSFLQKTLMKTSKNVLITVPAFQFLFSEHDRALKHFRRYNKAQLRHIANQCNLEISECFYFYFSLWFVRMLSKYLFSFTSTHSHKANVENWKFSDHSPITWIIKKILNFDFFIGRTLSRLGISIPGLSLCLIGKRKNV